MLTIGGMCGENITYIQFYEFRGRKAHASILPLHAAGDKDTPRTHLSPLQHLSLSHVQECFLCQYKHDTRPKRTQTHTQTLLMKSLCGQGGTKMTFKAFTLLADLSVLEGWSKRHNSRTMILVGALTDVQSMLSESYGQTTAESCWRAKATTVAYLASLTGSVGWILCRSSHRCRGRGVRAPSLWEEPNLCEV